jgi:hypothetical protein
LSDLPSVKRDSRRGFGGAGLEGGLGELLNAARAGDGTARHRVRAVSDRVPLATAQLAIAREYGFASWSKLKAEVEDRRKSLAELADEFCAASIRDWTARAARLLASHPELAGYSLATAILLGDAERVRAAIRRDPGQLTARQLGSGIAGVLLLMPGIDATGSWTTWWTKIGRQSLVDSDRRLRTA